MALVPCPACGLPRAAADAHSPCPACRWADLPEPAAAEVAAAPVADPVPPDTGHPPGRAVAAVLGVAVGVAATLAVGDFFARPATPPPAAPEVVEAAPPAPPAYPRVPTLPVAPPPRMIEPDAHPIVLPLPVPVDPTGGYAVLKADQPDGHFQLPRLGAGNKVKLVGKAKRLVIDGLDGGAELDATGLECDGTIGVGPLAGGAVARLKTTGTSVAFRAGVLGGSVVELDAPAAYVALAGGEKATGVAVGGGSRVTAKAKAVAFSGVVKGNGTVVDATFSPNGSLTLQAVEDGAVVRYRPEHRADPQVRVTRGRVAGGEVREEPPPKR